MSIQTNLRLPLHLFVYPLQYEIPAFQRRYVWKREEQWEPLWDDVEDLAQSILDGGQAKPHFMGAVVFQQKPSLAGTMERRIVVDGQQRLTTIQLLIDAIQEILEKKGYTDSAKRLERLVLNEEVYCHRNPNNTFKVWPTIADRKAFQHAMRNDFSSKAHAMSRIVQAHEFFKEKTEKWLNRFSAEACTREKAASALEDTVRTKLELVVIDLGESDDPHVIFETLNARGTPLLQSEMVKNMILHETNHPMDSENESRSALLQLWPFGNDSWWDKEVGRGFQRRPRIDLYLNHWLTLRNHKEMKAHDEFKAFKRYINQCREERKTIEDIAKDMNDIGQIYRDIEEVRRTDIKKFLDRINIMYVGVIIPLLLWLLSEDVPREKLERCLKALESFLVRRVICGYSARSYGIFFVGLLAKLHDSPVGEADRVLISHLAKQESQATLWPNDTELRDRLADAPLYLSLPKNRLRMVLTGIEEYLRTPRAEAQAVPDNLHIEHIMPQSWHRNWPIQDSNGEAAEERNRTIHTIGNLTLVNGQLNSSLSDSPWERKQKVLADHSVLFLNKPLANNGPKIWDETAIRERSKKLYEIAASVWPHFDDSKTS